MNLYAVTAMPPAARKSAVFAELTAPLMETEQALVEKTRPRSWRAETLHRSPAGMPSASPRAASGETDDDARKQAAADAIAAAQLAEAITVPVMPRLVADDVTPEAAASLLAEQGGRLAVLSAEGGSSPRCRALLRRRATLEVFLKGHSGDMLRVDRKGRPPEHIAQPGADPRPGRAARGPPDHRRHARIPRPRPARPDPLLAARQPVGTARSAPPPVPEEIRDAYAGQPAGASAHHGRMGQTRPS